MCSHDKFTIWLSHCHTVKVRVCQNCHDAEWLNVNQENPEWETMIAQILAEGGRDLAAPPSNDEIPF